MGFKWFVDGLVDGSVGFGGEESAGASFLRRDGSVWTTDKDGIIACLLAAEVTAKAGRNPARALRRAHRAVRRPGLPPDRRAGDARGEGRARSARAGVHHRGVARRRPDHGAGSPTRPATGRRSAGSRSTTDQAWFAARPSGTENVTKLYAESFRGEAHLEQVLAEAGAIVDAAV